MSRALIQVDGPDASDFLQGLITNDMRKVPNGPIYAALLTPQGKYLADFFVFQENDTTFIDIDGTLADGVSKRLSMYKLRANVTITLVEGRNLHRGFGDIPSDGWADPRHDALGWRAWRAKKPTHNEIDWTTLYVDHMVPQNGIELTTDSFILECNFEALNGVDFRKGCYVGQEVTARMKHKTELRKGLARVSVDGEAQQGADITAGQKVVGQLLTRAGDTALAYLRFDRVQDEMRCENARISIL